MAVPTTYKFGAGLFYLGNHANPPVFSKLCGVTKGEISYEKETKDQAIPDCADPDKPVWKVTDVTGMGWKMKLEGLVTAAALPLIEAATLSGVATPIRFYLKGGNPGGSGGPDKVYSGSAHVTHSISGQIGERWQISIEITGDGEPTIAPATIPTA